MPAATAELSIVIKARDAATAAIASLKGAIAGLSSAGNSISSAFRGGESSITKLNQGLQLTRQLTTDITRIATASVGAFVKGFIGAGASVERFKARLATLYKDEALAQQKFTEFAKLAEETPFELPDVVEAGVILETFGEKNDKAMMAIADLAAFMSDDMAVAAQAYGKAIAGGFGAADMLRERGVLAVIKDFAKVKLGINDLADLGDNFGKVMLAALTDPDGKIAGGAKRLSTLWDGIMSNMSDAWFRFQLAIAEAGIFEDLKQRAAALLQTIKDLEADGTLGRIAKTISDELLKGIEKFANWVKSLDASDLESLKAAFSDLATIIGGLGALTQTVLTGWNNLAVTVRDLGTRFKDTLNMGDEIVGKQEALLKLGSKLGISPEAGEGWAEYERRVMAVYQVTVKANDAIIKSNDALDTNATACSEAAGACFQSSEAMKAQGAQAQNMSKATTGATAATGGLSSGLGDLTGNSEKAREAIREVKQDIAELKNPADKAKIAVERLTDTLIGKGVKPETAKQLAEEFVKLDMAADAAKKNAEKAKTAGAALADVKDDLAGLREPLKESAHDAEKLIRNLVEAGNTEAVVRPLVEELFRLKDANKAAADAAGDYDKAMQRWKVPQQKVRELSLEFLELTGVITDVQRQAIETAADLEDLGIGTAFEGEFAVAKKALDDFIASLPEPQSKAIQDLIGAIGVVKKELPGWVSAFDLVGDSIQDVFEGIVLGTRDMDEIFEGLKTSIVGNLTDAFFDGLKAKTGFDKAFELNIFNLVKNVGGILTGQQGLGSIFDGVFKGLAALTGDGTETATGGIAGIFGKIADAFGGLLGVFQKLGKGLMSVVKGIGTAVGLVSDTAQVATTAASTASSAVSTIAPVAGTAVTGATAVAGATGATGATVAAPVAGSGVSTGIGVSAAALGVAGGIVAGIALAVMNSIKLSGLLTKAGEFAGGGKVRDITKPSSYMAALGTPSVISGPMYIAAGNTKAAMTQLLFDALVPFGSIIVGIMEAFGNDILGLAPNYRDILKDQFLSDLDRAFKQPGLGPAAKGSKGTTDALGGVMDIISGAALGKYGDIALRRVDLQDDFTAILDKKLRTQAKSAAEANELTKKVIESLFGGIGRLIDGWNDFVDVGIDKLAPAERITKLTDSFKKIGDLFNIAGVFDAGAALSASIDEFGKIDKREYENKVREALLPALKAGEDLTRRQIRNLGDRLTLIAFDLSESVRGLIDVYGLAAEIGKSTDSTKRQIVQLRGAMAAQSQAIALGLREFTKEEVLAITDSVATGKERKRVISRQTAAGLGVLTQEAFKERIGATTPGKQAEVAANQAARGVKASTKALFDLFEQAKKTKDLEKLDGILAQIPQTVQDAQQAVEEWGSAVMGLINQIRNFDRQMEDEALAFAVLHDSLVGGTDTAAKFSNVIDLTKARLEKASTAGEKLEILSRIMSLLQQQADAAIQDIRDRADVEIKAKQALIKVETDAIKANQEEIDTRREAIEARQEEIDKLQEEANALAPLASMHDGLRKQIEDIRRSTQTPTTNLAQMQSDMVRAQAAFGTATTPEEKAKAAGRISDLADSMLAAGATVFGPSSDKYLALQDQVVATLEEVDTQAASAAERMEAIQSRIEVLQGEIKTYEGEIKDYDKLIQESNDRIELLNQDIVDINERTEQQIKDVNTALAAQLQVLRDQMLPLQEAARKEMVDALTRLMPEGTDIEAVLNDAGLAQLLIQESMLEKLEDIDEALRTESGIGPTSDGSAQLARWEARKAELEQKIANRKAQGKDTKGAERELKKVDAKIKTLKGARFGGDEIFRDGTLLLVGEGGPERVKVTPLKGRGGGTDTVIHVTQHMNLSGASKADAKQHMRYAADAFEGELRRRLPRLMGSKVR